jgi:hypothetical protein
MKALPLLQPAILGLVALIQLSTLNPQVSPNLSLLLYGKNGTNYILQATTNLVNTNAWFPATNFVLTNSFQFINQDIATNRSMLFRAKRN